MNYKFFIALAACFFTQNINDEILLEELLFSIVSKPLLLEALAQRVFFIPLVITSISL